MSYNPAVFASLMDINFQEAQFLEHREHLLALDKIIAKHGLSDVLGVALVHRHFDLEDEERIVANVFSDGFTARPEILDESEVVPHTWKIHHDSVLNKWLWYPLEFFRDSGELGLEVEQAHALSRNAAFLDEFGRAAIELGVADIFGLSLLFNRHNKMEQGQILYEETDQVARIMAATLVTADCPGLQTAGSTQWHFNADGSFGQTIAGCSSGGSRCCCGV